MKLKIRKKLFCLLLTIFITSLSLGLIQDFYKIKNFNFQIYPAWTFRLFSYSASTSVIYKIYLSKIGENIFNPEVEMVKYFNAISRLRNLNPTKVIHTLGHLKDEEHSEEFYQKFTEFIKKFESYTGSLKGKMTRETISPLRYWTTKEKINVEVIHEF